MKIHCIIVDDEPVSRVILKKYIREIPSLELQCECSDAFEAGEHLSRNKTDLVFLDINMPRLSGISFARSLVSSPLLVFTTAYPEYAVEGFELNAVDYLVKPFSFERFMKSVNRAMELLEQSGHSPATESSVLVRADKRIYALKIPDILCVEGCGDYIRLVRKNEKPLIIHETIKNFLDNLPAESFIRVHRSYIVNLSAIEYIDGNTLFLKDRSVPLGMKYRQEFLDRLKEMP